jgi:hypothetical protein
MALFLISMRGGGFLGESFLWGLELKCLLVFLGGYSITMSGLDKKMGTRRRNGLENKV